ncbi:hypothetical protein D1164_18950 [Mariniphaga sediminis]|uniref:Activator of Hsp90 ATPase homologue 1/2-like C-terminal domain-containing protein n=1 Tax=Mariniphaga sediminis TaxID=1628158 RepID=A0A399CXH2_9BACT|nr:SRPBCC family protein [Mariniphaga sediminis]RIH63658.1 hypothetical protein D1164_18950 [Mariniphaga sediminis]
MKTIIIETSVDLPVEKVWNLWTDPQHIIHWNYAVDDWHCPKAENDLRVGGKLKARMEAKDGSVGFDFEGTYDEVIPNERMAYTLEDGRKVSVVFKNNGATTKVIEAFDTEDINPVEMQRSGWQAILNNFKKYAEKLEAKEKLHFEIVINAKPENVFETMLADKTFRKWTHIFNPTSHFKGSWEKGAKILFIGNDEQGNKGGMVSRIRENIPNRFISIEHLGIIEDGREITSGPKVESWAGGLENYSFTEQNGDTLLSVNLEFNSGSMDEQMVSFFSNTWPQALNTLKEICEQ